MADRDVTVDIIARDKTATGTRSAKRNMEGLDRSVRKVNDRLDDSGPIGRFTSRITGMAKKVSGKVNGIFNGFDAKAKAAFGLGLKAMLAAAIAGAPALSAAIIAAMALGVGGGVLAIGALALKENKRIVAGATKTGETIKKVLAKAAQPLVGPFVIAMARVRGLVKKLAPDLRGLFAGLAPVVPLLTNAFGGVLTSVVKSLRAGLPGITAAFRGLASALPTVGKWIGEFIRTLLGNPKVIENTTRAVTLLVAGPLKLLGPLLSGLNVIFGAQVNLMRIFEIGGGSLFRKLVTWLDGGSGAVKRLKEAWGPLWTAIQNVWTKLREFAEAKTDKDIVTKFAALIEAIKGLWGPLKTFIGTVWAEAWAAIKRIWNEKVVPWWNNTAKPWLKQAFSAAMDEAVSTMKAKAKAELAKLPGVIIGALASLPGKIQAALIGKMASAGRSIGSSLISGIIGAIAGGRGRIGSAVASAGAAAAAAAAANFSGGVGSWAPAVTAARFAGGGSFAMAGGGTSRAGGPVEVTSNLTVDVNLDGKPFHDQTVRIVGESQRRQAFRDKVGRR